MMITIKNNLAIAKMEEAGKRLANLFKDLVDQVTPGKTTLQLDGWIDAQLTALGLESKTKGYRGYKHSSCISINDELVHGVPSEKKMIKSVDLVKVDVCASWNGYCADMARSFCMSSVSVPVDEFLSVAQQSLDDGIEQAVSGAFLSNISAAIQKKIEKHGYGVVKDFAGHGIGKKMHEDPEILNYGRAGYGPKLRSGMTFALEPMLTMGLCDVYVDPDGWTVKTKDASLSAHVEDTILVTDDLPRILTRLQ